MARPGERRVWVLNASASAIWDLAAEGLSDAALAERLAPPCGLSPAAIRAEIAALTASWRAAGHLPGAAAVPEPDPDAAWVIPPVYPAAPAGALTYQAAGLTFGLTHAPGLAVAALTALLAPWRSAPVDRSAHHLHLTGQAHGWTLQVNGQDWAKGQDADAAQTAVLHALMDLACRAEDRLLVIHGAGLMRDDGTGLLLVAPGGSGKTTLAAALNAEGLALLSDDVVPVNQDGQLLALGAPLCLKSGSWPVLAGHRPDLASAPTVQRYGQAVRYLPPRGTSPRHPIVPRRLLFPRYQPDTAPHAEALNPEQALQGLIEAEAVIRNLTQAKLTALADWVSALPAYALTYSDLASGLALVRGVGGSG